MVGRFPFATVTEAARCIPIGGLVSVALSVTETSLPVAKFFRKKRVVPWRYQARCPRLRIRARPCSCDANPRRWCPDFPPALNRKVRASDHPTSCRSRKLGTAFRSPVTTLSPPLRGQHSRPAPSLPRQCFFAHPLDRRLLARFGFEAETGRIHHLRPVVRADLRRCCAVSRSPLPLRFFNPPDQSVQPASSQQARHA